MSAVIGHAATADWPRIETLIRDAGLPIDGLREHLETTLVAKEGGAVVGCAALELYDDAALLRSVAVEGPHRGRGLGRDLTMAALLLAREREVRLVVLLTETAGAYFPRFGFRPADRADVPDAVRRSVEFTSACPVSAQVMVLRLAPEAPPGRVPASIASHRSEGIHHV